MGVVQLDQDGRVIDFVEKPENPASNIAVYASYIYSKDTLPLFSTYMQEGNKPDAPGYFPAWLYKRKSIYAYSFEGECYDIGTHESLAEVRRRYTFRS
jgi:glucose-1-phosphate thymidylyltransferase